MTQKKMNQDRIVRARKTKEKANQQKGKRGKNENNNKKEKMKMAPKGATATRMSLEVMLSARSFFEEPVAERMVLPAKLLEWRRATQDA